MKFLFSCTGTKPMFECPYKLSKQRFICRRDWIALMQYGVRLEWNVRDWRKRSSCFLASQSSCTEYSKCGVSRVAKNTWLLKPEVGSKLQCIFRSWCEKVANIDEAMQARSHDFALTALKTWDHIGERIRCNHEDSMSRGGNDEFRDQTQLILQQTY